MLKNVLVIPMKTVSVHTHYMDVNQKNNFYFWSKTKYAHFSADIHSFSIFFLNERSHFDYYLDLKIRFRKKLSI